MNTPRLADFWRIVVKIGSSLLVDAKASRLNEKWLASLAADIAALYAGKRDLLVVSSGAIALGRSVLKLPAGPLALEDSQAAAAVGQIALARTWTEALSRHGITAGQVLVTLGDTEERRRYLNARSTIDRLLQWRAVPVINENDTVATNEIRYGDNDRLAARVATMILGPVSRSICKNNASRSAVISGSGKTYSIAVNSASGRNSASGCQLSKLS